MKKLILIGVATLLATVSQANPLQDFLDAGITNGAAGGGYWRATHGNYSIYSYDLLYNLAPSNNSLGAGLIFGGDYLRGSKGVSEFNDVKGGFALDYTVAPLKAIGLTNFVVDFFGGTALATPHNSSSGIGTITFAGVDWAHYVYKKLAIHVDPSWETRTGQGQFDRSYVGIQAYFSINF